MIKGRRSGDFSEMRLNEGYSKCRAQSLAEHVLWGAPMAQRILKKAGQDSASGEEESAIVINDRCPVVAQKSSHMGCRKGYRYSTP